MSDMKQKTLLLVVALLLLVGCAPAPVEEPKVVDMLTKPEAPPVIAETVNYFEDVSGFLARPTAPGRKSLG